MRPHADLTRWNRAGLGRVRYVDGNAVSYLEELRERLAAEFPEWERVRGERSESQTARQERLQSQYLGASKDPGFEIVRALARSCHVLTEYLDAYANEGFLSTATQWESVRRLVAILDHHPSPPSSAATLLALVVPDDVHAVGGDDVDAIVGAGFQVQHVPADGGAPVVFETLDGLAVDATLNALRPHGHERNPRRLVGSLLRLEGSADGLRTGEPLLLEDERDGSLAAHLVEGLREREQSTEVEVAPTLSSRFLAGSTVVHAKPLDRLAALGPAVTGVAGVGATVHLVDEPTGLRPGEVVYISDGADRHYFRRLRAVEGRRLVLDRSLGPLDVGRATVARPFEIPVAGLAKRTVGGDAPRTYVRGVRLPGDWTRLYRGPSSPPVADRRGGALVEYTVIGAQYTRPEARGADGGPTAEAGHTVLRLSTSNAAADPRNPQSLLLPPDGPGPWALDTVLQRPSGALSERLQTSVPRRAAAADLVALVRGGQAAWGRLEAVVVDRGGDRVQLTVDRWREFGAGPYFLAETAVFAHFERRLRVLGWQRNDTRLTEPRVPIERIPPALRRGRRVVLRRLDDPDRSVAAAVASVDHTNSVIELDEAPPQGTTYENLEIAGNVVAAGHGRAMPERVLGSGDASTPGQSFLLDVEGVSFVADPTQRSGVRAAITVTVEGRAWQQVATLSDSGPTDAHYTVRLTEAGHLRLGFGDGRRGRRLPSGAGNVRVFHRVGVGLAGNLSAGSLTQPVRSHRLVAAVEQPLPATGGSEIEGAESLREHAPATVLTLERAVSLSDFENLATAHSGVWQARARRRPTESARHESVDVIVVPAGGGELGDLGDSLRAFLELHTLPGVDVDVVRYAPIPLHLVVTVRVDLAAYDPAAVVAATRAALRDAFSLERRRLGQPLYRSDIVQVVEAVRGVESSWCVIEATTVSQEPSRAPRRVSGGNGRPIRSIQPYEGQLVAIVPAVSSLTVEAREDVR